ncbi:MAG: hypothetical protein H8D56_10025 [Planctomycetes bacterium]|nr:hypothetical protein [Planctomycetota bacterium]MBL7143577.1 hypothetical protein [Phycisphaerae bacterium]
MSSLFSVSYLAGQNIESEKQITLTINVTNSTANGTPTVNNEVLVTIFEQGKLTQTLKGNVDSEGKAVFENVPTGNNVTALPRIKHQNMMFNGHPIALKTGQTVFNGHVEVYEVSTDKSKLSVATHHFIIKVEADALRITEYMRLDNSSDMAITSVEKDENDKSKVIEAMLPVGFKDLTLSKYFQENALVITKDGFYDTMATPPGQYDAEFSYSLDIDSETIDIIKKISLPTSEFMVFSLLDKGRLKGLGDSKGEVNLADGSSAEYFSFSELKVAEQIKFQAVGFTVTKSNSSTSITLIVVFALIAVLVIWRLRSQQS